MRGCHWEGDCVWGVAGSRQVRCQGLSPETKGSGGGSCSRGGESNGEKDSEAFSSAPVECAFHFCDGKGAQPGTCAFESVCEVAGRALVGSETHRWAGILGQEVSVYRGHKSEVLDKASWTLNRVLQGWGAKGTHCSPEAEDQKALRKASVLGLEKDTGKEQEILSVQCS